MPRPVFTSLGSISQAFCHAPGVAGVHGWALPAALKGRLNISGGLSTDPGEMWGVIWEGQQGGAFVSAVPAKYTLANVTPFQANPGRVSRYADLEPGRVTPTAARLQVSAFGSLATVYLGKPAS
jgi:hypothetical protein